jgi:hypothetical protein
MRVHKKKINKERFSNFIGLVALTVLIVIAIKNPTQGPVSQWHDAIEKGTSWAEYVKGGEINVD